MSFKMNKLFKKWSCFGGKSPTTEDEVQNSLRLNQPKIIITECKSGGTTPSISRKSSSSSDEDVEDEMMLRTDGEIHKMGLSIVVQFRKLDQTDGNDNEDLSVLRVTDVEVGSFAHGFGVRKGDIISKVNGTYCCGDILDIKEEFLSQTSENLQMEILRKTKNYATGDTELLKMTISNQRHIGGTTEEMEIIKVSSSWSLSDSSEYLQLDEAKYFLQFASAESPWVVDDDNRLSVKRNLTRREVERSAEFRIRVYFSLFMPETGNPVVIQHVYSGRCVALVDDDIRLVNVDQLDTVTDHSILFIERLANIDAGGSNKTYQSLWNTSLYLGFDTENSTPDGHAQPIKVSSSGGLGNKERNVVFIATEA